ncbi:hypothetical protein [Embleya hyalina]|uniref:Uncharacterized protein n=1 Tax=Embleya hyalina TaxID=516124 RepID=A0A401Z5P4_9ACTN|nr:hypothetical protein [Embleya hyalina]GCE02174.1 hypothetical protein EHYA_09951 [Embleya hyalina]
MPADTERAFPCPGSARPGSPAPTPRSPDDRDRLIAALEEANELRKALDESHRAHARAEKAALLLYVLADHLHRHLTDLTRERVHLLTHPPIDHDRLHGLDHEIGLTRHRSDITLDHLDRARTARDRVKTNTMESSPAFELSTRVEVASG